LAFLATPPVAFLPALSARELTSIGKRTRGASWHMTYPALSLNLVPLERRLWPGDRWARRFVPVLLPLLSAVSLILVLLTPSDAQAAPPRVDFNRQVKPILSSKCFHCHGPDAKERKGGTDGLRLDTWAGATLDLGGYAAIVPEHPEESALIERIVSDEPEERMPPTSSGHKLANAEIDVLKLWISQGANYARHWSYVKPARPEFPRVEQTSWPRNPIDYFLLARLEQEKLRPTKEADRAALIRRASLDLVGLPPSLDEVDAFVQDSDPHAYQRLVDRLLAKPAYGEHWARLWLDLARYADSAGYADDPPRTIWQFRDYVIRAFNSNKPFDQFTIEQVAGDLLPSSTDDQIIATAFHRNTLTNNEGGTNDEEFRNVAIVDRVNTTMAVWMGTTMSCAQCHDHKFDPLSQEEYFRLFAFFNNTEDADRTDESPLLPIFTPEQNHKRGELQAAIATIDDELRRPKPELRSSRERWAATFPVELKWTSPKPLAVKTEGSVAKITDDGAIEVAPGGIYDTYTVEVPFPAMPLRAVRLEALPLDSLPGRGPGHANGNFTVSRLTAKLTLPPGYVPPARYVRIELAGSKRVLSLSEVQVFSAGKNIALKGTSRQSSTDFGGADKLAIDGNTDGRYLSGTTTNTAESDNPWWELDLGSEQPIERVVVWNRTDDGTIERLKDFRVVLLSTKQGVVWQQAVTAPPKPSVELSTASAQMIVFDQALVDYTQPGFDPADVIRTTPPSSGWAIGEQNGQAHVLTLVAARANEAPAGSKLTITIEHSPAQPRYLLGHFRLALTDHPGAAKWGSAPVDVLNILARESGARSTAQSERLAAYYQSIAPELDTTRRQRTKLDSELQKIRPVTVPIMKELAQGGGRVTKIQYRGNYTDLGGEVTPGTPAVFPPLTDSAPQSRLSLAKWLVDENNPLTARVVANRYWEQIFGIGIVASSEEFGSQGELPTHPELLDYLASELVRLRWDTKAFLKLLVTSAAYRQSSLVTPELQRRDPDNRLLARGPRFRLSAEMVRDQALFAAGLLSNKMYGPPVNPPQPALGLSAAFGGKTDWETSAGEDRYRRAIYTAWRRSNPYPSMSTFDAPNREVCTLRRTRTNTPLQALVTLNDPVYIEAAQALARRIAAVSTDPTQRMRLGFRLCIARAASDEEVDRLVNLYRHAATYFEGHPEHARRMATEPSASPPAPGSVTELAALTAVSNVLLNLDETLMKR